MKNDSCSRKKKKWLSNLGPGCNINNMHDAADCGGMPFSWFVAVSYFGIGGKNVFWIWLIKCILC